MGVRAGRGGVEDDWNLHILGGYVFWMYGLVF